VPVGVVRRLVPAHAAHRETFRCSTVLVDLSSVAARCAQLSRQCLQFICSSPHLSVAAVRCILRLSASVAVTLAAEAMTSSNAMKVRKPEPAEIEYKNMKFLITYRPTDATMDRFIEVCLSQLSYGPFASPSFANDFCRCLLWPPAEATLNIIIPPYGSMGDT